MENHIKSPKNPQRWLDPTVPDWITGWHVFTKIKMQFIWKHSQQLHGLQGVVFQSEASELRHTYSSIFIHLWIKVSYLWSADLLLTTCCKCWETKGFSFKAKRVFLFLLDLQFLPFFFHIRSNALGDQSGFLLFKCVPSGSSPGRGYTAAGSVLDSLTHNTVKKPWAALKFVHF